MFTFLFDMLRSSDLTAHQCPTQSAWSTIAARNFILIIRPGPSLSLSLIWCCGELGTLHSFSRYGMQSAGIAHTSARIATAGSRCVNSEVDVKPLSIDPAFNKDFPSIMPMISCFATQEEYNSLIQELGKRKRGTKEVESAVAGEPPCVVEVDVPSAFCYYPSVKRRAEELKKAGNVETALVLLHNLSKLIVTGQQSELITSLLAEKTEERVVDLSEDGEDTSKPQVGQWQVSLGAEGWMDFPPDSNHIVEESYQKQRGIGKCIFRDPNSGEKYSIDFKTNLQTNLRSKNVRPVRREVP